MFNRIAYNASGRGLYYCLISFARLRTGASALYFLVYEWIFSEREGSF